MHIIENIVYPRFRSRRLIDKFKFNLNLENSDVFKLLKEITRKDTILDYSQLRIGLLHFLNEVLPKGAKVATTSYTIFDMINIIINSGKEPIFVDIEKKNLGPNLEKLIEAVINKKVDCVIYTYLHGYRCNIKKLSDICKKYNCLLIEDCAQSLWSIENDYYPGSFGDIALFSTGLFKNINTISGGLLCINSDSVFANKLTNSHKKLPNKFSKDFVKRFLYAIFLDVLQVIFSFLL